MVVIIYWLILFVFVIKNGCTTTAVSEPYVRIYNVQQSVKQGNWQPPEWFIKLQFISISIVACYKWRKYHLHLLFLSSFPILYHQIIPTNSLFFSLKFGNIKEYTQDFELLQSLLERLQQGNECETTKNKNIPLSRNIQGHSIPSSQLYTSFSWLWSKLAGRGNSQDQGKSRYRYRLRSICQKKKEAEKMACLELLQLLLDEE